MRGRRQLLAALNASVTGRQLLDAGDTYQIVQRIAAIPGLAPRVLAVTSPQQEPEQVKLSEIPLASMEDLVKAYNKHAEKPIAKFRNRATAEERLMAVLPPQRGRKPINPTITYSPNGRSQVRASSVRGQVLAYIQEHSPVAKQDLDRAFGINTAGYIDKLAEMEHVKVSD